jgi:uncharacterized SAM-binding protein YcdF (DUF218 family)
MGLYEFLLSCILFVCGMIIFTFLRVIALPFDIGYPSLDPLPVTGFTWGVLMFILYALVLVFFVIVLLLFLIYLIVRNIPIFGPIIVNSTPFRELRDTGLFDLMESFLVMFFSGFSSDSVRRFGRDFGNFFLKSWTFAKRVLGGGGGQPRNQTGLPGNHANSGNGTSDNEDSNLSEAERFQIRDEYVRCLREGIGAVSPDASKTKQKLQAVKNEGVRMQCQVKNIATYMHILSSNRKFFKD